MADLPSGKDDARPDAQGLVHQHTLRVYWEDTDAGGIVFYANYLKFFERARTEWLRAAGIGQQALRERTGAIFVVAETALRYHRPARLDDELRVTVVLQEAGRASMAIDQQAWRGEELLAEGRIRIGCVDERTLRPCRIPAEVLQALQRLPAPAHGRA
jgi:acyl-CoA thioester hydrolase